MERVINAKEWRVSHDLGGGLSALGWSANYEALDARGQWDPTLYDDVRPYHGEDDPDTVIIKATVDGLTETIVDGVVDESGFDVHDDGLSGVLVGRDKAALLLDRSPSSELTLMGAEYKDGQLRYHNSFKSAIQAVCRAAGMTVMFHGPIVDYKLGANVVVTPQRTYADAIAELMGPLRWSERHTVDAWVDGDVLHVSSRDADRYDPVPVFGEMIISASVSRSRKPTQSVRVEGFSYQIQIDDSVSSKWPPLPDGHEYVDKPASHDERKGGIPEPKKPTPGLPWAAAYSWPETRSSSETVMGRTESYTVKEIEWYNERGQLTRVYRRKSFTSQVREETTRVEYAYDEGTANKSFGNKVREVEVHHVKYYAVVQSQVVANYDEVVRERKTSWTYWPDNGDTRTMNALEVEMDESAGIGPLPLKMHRVTTQTFRRSMGQVWRETEIVETDKDGVVKRSLEVKEVGPFQVEFSVAAAGTSPLPGKRGVDVIVASGPKNAATILRSGLVGDAASASALRSLVLDDQAADKVVATVRGLPDLRIRTASSVIFWAPSWLPADVFFVTSLSMNESTSEVRGITWLA